jgi:hypothetical protein
MALTRAPQGGDGLDFDAVKEALIGLAKREAKVVFRVLELHDPVPGKNGDMNPTTADMVVCSGPDKGKTLMNFRHIGKGITGPLRRAFLSGEKEVAARLELKSGVQKWVAAQTPNDDDFDLIAAFYGDGSKAWSGPALVEIDEDAPASSGLGRVGSGGATDDDSEPPF